MRQKYRASWQRQQKAQSWSHQYQQNWNTQEVGWCQVRSVGALGLAGMVSTSLREARGVLCFGRVTKAVLTTGPCVGCCRAVLSHFPTLPPAVSRLRMGTKLGRDTTWTVNPNWPRVYSMPYNALENWRKGILGEADIAIGQRLTASVYLWEVMSDCIHFTLEFFPFLFTLLI